jgi:hypothetical protein
MGLTRGFHSHSCSGTRVDMLGLSGETNDTITLTILAFAVPRQVVGGDFL